MALETNIIEFPVTQGQNEGQAVQVLPVGQFSSLRNARFRKNNLLGKRNGYTSKSSLDASGAPLGNGTGNLACLGPNFCAVDDRFYLRNEHSDNWALPPKLFSNGPATGNRLPGRFPQFVPGPAFDTLINNSDTTAGGAAGTAQESVAGITYGLGLIWTATTFYDLGAGTGWQVTVVATDPATGLNVFQQELGLSSATATDQPGIVLLTTGDQNTIVLIADRFTAGTKTSVAVSVLTSVTAGFGAEVLFNCIQSAANYDPFTPTGILFAYALTGTPATFNITRMNPATMVATASATRAVGGNKTLLSCFGNSVGSVWCGYDAGGTITSVTFDSTLTLTGANTTWTAQLGAISAPIMFAARSTTDVVGVVTYSSKIGHMEVDNGGLVSLPLAQLNVLPLSQPFSVGSQVFIWARHIAGLQLGVATLLRVPLQSEYTNGAFLNQVYPVEATVDNYDAQNVGATKTYGPVPVTPVATPLGYVTLLRYARATFVLGGATVVVPGFAVLPVRHRSEGIRYAASCVVSCGQRQFVACAQPLWVDALGQSEAGFIQAPVSVAAPVSGGGGALTTNSTYSYSATFTTIAANGEVERSGPAVPVTVAIGLNTKITVSFSTMAIGMKTVVCNLYRTAANGSVFYYVSSVRASPGSNVLGNFTFADVYADSDITQNEALYVNVGQELAASNAPACAFANTGGNRLWCAGGFAGNAWQASKQFLPHIVPEFADDDAFRGSLPADITGSAWCDQQIFFTQEGIYAIGGDGPDGSGNGFFVTTRLPFNIGCIDWRSVVVCDLGVMFQSARGLYLLPRGLGQPVAMDQVLDTLTTYPVITSARADYNSRGGADNSEQIVQWTAVSDEAGTSGVTITFDVAYKAFYIDTCNADYPATFASGWDGDGIQSPAVMTVGPNGASKWHPFRLRDASYSDGGLPIDMSATTGDIRPWGTFAHGVVNRVGVLGVLGSACTVSATKLTDRGTRTTTRVYTGVAPDYVPSADVYLDVELGGTEQRDVTALRFTVAESSAVEGVAFIGLIIETDEKPQGFRLLKPGDRIV